MNVERKTIVERTQESDTEELLDRATVFREDMEPDAIRIIEAELSRRGYTEDAILAHAKNRCESNIVGDDGTALRCSLCDRPAIVEDRDWFRVFGKLPIFPRSVRYCELHARERQPVDTAEDRTDEIVT